MRFLITSIFLFIALSGVFAQDGIYCSFSGGQMLLDADGINKTLQQYKSSSPSMTEFKPAFLNYSGELHFIMGKRFVLGGKGFMFSQDQHAPLGQNRKMKIFGTMMTGNLGFTVVDGKENGIRLFPQIGVGMAKTGFQVKDTFSVDNDALNTLLIGFVSDNRAEINKKELVIDACLGIDWDWGFFPSVNIMSGIGCRPLLHAEFGYTYVPKEQAWMRGPDKITATEPKINFGGLYYGFGIGFGFTGAK